MRIYCAFSSPFSGGKHPCPLSMDVPFSQGVKSAQCSWCNIYLKHIHHHKLLVVLISLVVFTVTLALL